MRRLLAALLLAGACDTQVDGDYGGEPQLVLDGVIVAGGFEEVSRLELRWSTDDPLGPGEPSAVVLHTSFPNRFQAGVLSLPPAPARMSFGADQPAFAEAYLFAESSVGATLGADFGHALVWLAGDAPPDGELAAYLGAPLAAGFHVLTRVETPSPPREQATFVAACEARARAQGLRQEVCPLGRSYRLSPSPGDLDEVWIVHGGGAP